MSDDLSGFSLMDLFRSEADGQIALMTEGLLALEDESTPSPAALEALMRAAHSLKGAARIVGLDAAVRVAHALEDDFVAAQRGELAIKSPDVDVLLKAVDLLGQIAMLPEERSASWQLENEGRIEATVASLVRLRTRVVEPSADVNGSPPTLALPRERGGDQTGGGDQAEPVTLDRPPSLLPPSPLAGEGRAGGQTVVFEDDPSPVQSPEPVLASTPEATGRVVRVSAESLSRLMGLAGESLVQARQLRPFVDALVALRARQGALIEALQEAEERRVSGSSSGSASAGVAELLARARSEAARCIDDLNRKVDTFDDYAR
ncbi:MAG: Hpt domain-containing protein, partial [Thermoplasmata archaeon]|nr:Hpt domain-containing protein [Thermoplasmata archaeon]